MQLNSKELKQILHDNGASIVGYADLAKYVDDDLRSGVSVVINLPREVVRSIANGPTREYFDAYHELNNKLDRLAVIGADYLKSFGYRAIPQTTDFVKEDETYTTKLPHKTVAVQSGIGWIGKSALFITKQYGAAVRLSSIITDAPLDYGNAATKSKCRNCSSCVEACPAKALTGRKWVPGMQREELFDAVACRTKAREAARDLLGEEITLCGKCIEVCPYTRRFTIGGKL